MMAVKNMVYSAVCKQNTVKNMSVNIMVYSAGCKQYRLILW